MIELLLLDQFSDAHRASPSAGWCKWFQRVQMQDLCRKYHNFDNFCEIGCHNYFELLSEYPGTKIVIDPYLGGGGAGLDKVPENLPYPSILFRCMLGLNSAAVPSNFIDFSYSVSVIEHIGQAEVNYDCSPCDTPPIAQEMPRDAFCEELYRITRPGGVTIHSIDHAPRNRSFVANFLRAGFKLLHDDPMPSLDELLNHPGAVRQRHGWLDQNEPMSADEQRLHSVLTLGFRKPSHS